MRRRPRRVCVLVSGGLDSSMLVADMLRQGYEVYPFYVRSGFYWEKVEMIWLRRLLKSLSGPRLKPLTVADSPASGILLRHWSLDGRGVPSAKDAWNSVYLPGRNLLLLGQAGLFCSLRGIPLLAQGLLKGNPFGDATPRFRRAMERAIAAGLDGRIKLVAPYAKLSKLQVLKRVEGFPVDLTFSCLKPRGMRHCGGCSKCEERGRCLSQA
jgi:7-cyano-7-deazaguanine synthase